MRHGSLERAPQFDRGTTHLFFLYGGVEVYPPVEYLSCDTPATQQASVVAQFAAPTHPFRIGMNYSTVGPFDLLRIPREM